MVQPFDLADAMTIVDIAAAGGFMQDGDKVTLQVFVEITATPIDADGPEAKFRFVMGMDQYFPFMARMEHAGKTSLVLSL
jgi:hypothetical protein